MSEETTTQQQGEQLQPEAQPSPEAAAEPQNLPAPTNAAESPVPPEPASTQPAAEAQQQKPEELAQRLLEPPTGPRLRRASRYVREAMNESAGFFVRMVLIGALWGTSALFTFWFLVIRPPGLFNFGGFFAWLFTILMPIPGLLMPLIISVYQAAFIPLRVFSEHGRRDAYVHPKWKRLLPAQYVWSINGKVGVAMNADGTPFRGRVNAPVVTDDEIYIARDNNEVIQAAHDGGPRWEKIDPWVLVIALAILAFLALVMMSEQMRG